MPPNSQKAPHLLNANEVLELLGSDMSRGLAQSEAQARLQRYGRNVLATEKPVPEWRKLLAQLQDALVILLIIATVISAALWLIERDAALPYEASAIFLVVLLNAILGYVQGRRAELAGAAQRTRSATKANVIRGGPLQSVPAEELVPGDMVLIGEGDTIPEDGRIAQAIALQTAEAALTGESLPVPKDTKTLT